MSIIQMPDALANKIAAGEVVERPASVVKELIENSIDANSTWIKVELAEAGLDTIKISDNGDGMTGDDCEQAFLRHATSKIKNETDLFHVRTLGFRGEALASIAAVSRLTVKTSQGEQAGTVLELEGGRVLSRDKGDARRGSEITVKDLFFNTPARLKYMKTIHTELGNITDLLNRLALSHPAIRFEAVHNGKSLFQTNGNGDLLQVIAQVYGMGVARKMLPIKLDTRDFSVAGYIAKPEITRATRSYISTIINGRYIKSIPLSKAIYSGYHTLLPIGRQPIVVLNIAMDPILVDVNVHPAKLEVRFSKEKELFETIETAIRSKFRETTLIPEMEQEQPDKKSIKSTQRSFVFDHTPVKTEDQTTIEPNSGEQGPVKAPFDWQTNPQINEQQPTLDNADLNWPGMEPNTDESPLQSEGGQAHPTDIQIDHNQDTAIKTGEARIPTMYPIGQLQGTYIMAQNDNGLYMIDQHAAQERIKFEYFSEKLGETTNQVQELLIPLTFEFSKQEAIFIETHQETFSHVGLVLEPFGDQTYVVRSCPTWFPKGYEEEVIREMVQQIMEQSTINIGSIREDAAAMMSCKGSIKANHHLNHDDMFHLLEELRQSTDPFTCPHGRPIIVHFSSYELEKMFKRVM